LKYLLNPQGFKDWDGLHQLLTDCFSYMQGLIDPPSSLNAMTEKSLQDKAEQETFLIVYENNQLIGCGFFEVRQSTVYVGKVAVKTTHRGQGIARQIFEYAKELARENGISTLELETRIELTQNHRTFEKLGFEIISKDAHPGFDRPTFVVMQLKL